MADAHTVREGRDIEHVQQGSLGGSDLVTGLYDLQIGCNFNGTTGNLSWNTESLEERGLAGFHTGVPSRDVDIVRGNGTSTSGGSDLVGENLLTDDLEIAVREDETDVALNERKEAFVLGGLRDEALNSTAHLLRQSAVFKCQARNGNPHHGVLAHEDNTLTPKRESDLVHLLGADIVDADDEDGPVLL